MKKGVLAFERYRIGSRIGAGSMGTVYRAVDIKTERPVALKVMPQATMIQAERFATEASTLASLHHPGIVRYLDHGRGDDEAYLAMEWLDGEVLSSLVKRITPSIAESLRIAKQIAGALRYAHSRGVLHRDIKPQNLFLLASSAEHPALDRVKLLDFGIARLARAGRSITMTGELMGTPGYIAPEQARGSKQLDGRVDLYSLGCLLFRCIAGRPAFEGDSVVEILAKTVLDAPPQLREFRADVPVELDRLCGRLLSKDPDDRPPDARMLLRELEAIELLLGPSSSVRGPIGAAPSAVGLTSSERRVLSVLLAGELTEDGTSFVGPVLDFSRPSRTREAAITHIESHGGRYEQTVDGSLLVTLCGSIPAPEQAAVAARCALGLHRLLGTVPVALVTGTEDASTTQRASPTGGLVTRGVRMLEHAPKEGVRLDDATAGLLDLSFDMRRDDHGLYLVRERETVQPVRTLFGQPYPCVGRDNELAYLEGIFDECVSEPRARVVLITSEAGRGKSKLRFELMRRVCGISPRPTVLMARGDSLTAGSPFRMLASTLRHAAGIVDEDSPDVKRARLRTRVSRHLPNDARSAEIAAFLEELINVPSPLGSSPAVRAARENAQLMGDAMLTALQDFLAAETRAGPVVLVLEDLHWGDVPSVRMIDAVLRQLAHAPLFVVALARPEVHSQFPALWEEREPIELRLAPLTKRASRELVRTVLGDLITQKTLDQLVERAGGNPFYLEELMRAIRDGGDAGTLPPTVLAMVQARLDALGPEAKRVLRAASIYGREFSHAGVLALDGDAAQRGPPRHAWLTKWLEDLVNRELIACRGLRPDGEDSAFYFRQTLIRDAAYAMLTARDRALGHRMAGQWLVSAGETDPVVLAEHFDRGGASGRAIAWYRRAAELALEGNDLEAAVEHAKRGLACHAEGEDRGALCLTMAEAKRWLGEVDTGLDMAEQAIAVLSPQSPLWFRAVAEASSAAERLGRVAKLTELVEGLDEWPATDDIAHYHLNCVCRGASALLMVGHPIAQSLCDRVGALAARIANLEPLVDARVKQLTALRQLQSGHAAHQAHHEALAAYEAAGDWRSAAVSQISLGASYLELGAFDRAERMFHRAHEVGERLEILVLSAWSQHNLGNLQTRRGHYDSADAFLKASSALGEKLEDRRLLIGNGIYAAQLATARADDATAMRIAQQTVDMASDQPSLRLGALAVWGHALLEAASRAGTSDRPHELRQSALEKTQEALDILTNAGGREGEFESLLRLTHARALAACGQADAAARAIETARDRLMSRAKRIEDDQLRHHFLTDLWENAMTLQAAKDAGFS